MDGTVLIFGPDSFVLLDDREIAITMDVAAALAKSLPGSDMAAAGFLGVAAAAGARGADPDPDPALLVREGADGVLRLAGAGAGPIMAGLDADRITFSRDGAEQIVSRLPLIAFESASGAVLRSLLFEVPDGASLSFTGAYGGLEALVFNVVDGPGGPGVTDRRSFTLDSSGLGGVTQLVFAFEDASDEVLIGAGSDLTGFTTIEIKRGTVDLQGAMIEPEAPAALTALGAASGIPAVIGGVSTGSTRENIRPEGLVPSHVLR
jgi:hypothetical protein